MIKLLRIRQVDGATEIVEPFPFVLHRSLNYGI